MDLYIKGLGIPIGEFDEVDLKTGTDKKISEN